MKNSFKQAIGGKDYIAIIAEIKRYSPSYGKPFPERSVAELVAAYEKGGASAISVVTEPTIFKGSLALLEEARKLTELPLLRKDFLTTVADLDESKLAGADAVLLIAKKLETAQLKQLAEYAAMLELDAVIEIHDDEDFEKIQGLKNFILGVNNRNLKTFATDVMHTHKFLSKIGGLVPPSAACRLINLEAQIIIAESAFKSVEDLQKYDGKIDAALIGTALLIAENPFEKLTKFTHAHRPA